jgi:hypothetical protein
VSHDAVGGRTLIEGANNATALYVVDVFGNVMAFRVLWLW